MIRHGFRIGLFVALGLFGILAFSALAQSAGSTTPADHMHEHYQWVTQIQAAIIRGDLAAVRKPAQLLAEHSAPADNPVAWKPDIEAMRSAARKVLEAPDLKTAATATSKMATACGNCHVATDVSDQFEWSDEPDYDTGNLAHMERHQWAADRMWEGLIGPSDESWYRGTKLLLEGPLSTQKLNAQDDSANSIRNMARRIHQLGANGTMEYEMAGKAEIYAEFLATCAACHTRLGQGPER